MTRLSSHASKRLTQRGIPDLMVPILEAFGEREHQSGGVVYHFTKRSRRRALAAIKQIAARWDSLQDTYFVATTDESQVITAGHHHQRIRIR